VVNREPVKKITAPLGYQVTIMSNNKSAEPKASELVINVCNSTLTWEEKAARITEILSPFMNVKDNVDATTEWYMNQLPVSNLSRVATQMGVQTPYGTGTDVPKSILVKGIIHAFKHGTRVPYAMYYMGGAF
jgi:hypothetical protein